MPSARSHRKRRPATGNPGPPNPERGVPDRKVPSPRLRGEVERKVSSPRLRGEVGGGPHRFSSLALGVAAVLITLLVFGRVAGNDFVLWDDTVEIYRNGYLNPPSWDHLVFLWTHPYLEQYVPFTDTAWSLLSNLGRLDAPSPGLTDSGALLDPHVFHAANLLLHLGSVLLAFFVLRRLTGAALPSAAGALLFAVHPLQVESVAWASELRGILAGFLGLAAILLYIDFTRTQGRMPYGLALLAALLAMLSKPSAAALPLVLLVLDRFALGRDWRRAVLALAPFLALSIPFLVLAPLAQPVDPTVVTPLWQRPLVAADALAFYLQKLVLPVGLGIDYGRSPAAVLSAWWGWLSWLVPAAIAVAAWLLRRRLPWLLPAVLIPALVLAPVLGLVPFAFQHYSTVADRYAYLALLGPAFGVACGLRDLEVRARLLYPTTAVALAALAALTFVQAGTWTDTQTLMRHAIEVNPRSDVAYNNLGIVLGQHGRLEEAKAVLLKSISLSRTQYQAHSNLGNVLFLQHHPDEAIAEYRTSIAINDRWDESHANLGNVLSSEGRWQEAIDEYRIALKLNPTSTRNQSGYNRALVGLQTGR